MEDSSGKIAYGLVLVAGFRLDGPLWATDFRTSTPTGTLAEKFVGLECGGYCMYWYWSNIRINSASEVNRGRTSPSLVAKVLIRPFRCSTSILTVTMTVKTSLRAWLVVLVIGFAVLAGPQQALAHTLEAHFQPQSESLEIQAIFSTGEFYDGADVVVHPPSDAEAEEIQGLTDEDGRFVFEPDYDLVGDWTIEVGEGNHWDLLIVPVADGRIGFDQITQLHPELPHHHHHYASNQLFVAAIALGSFLGSRLLRGRFSL